MDDTKKNEDAIKSENKKICLKSIYHLFKGSIPEEFLWNPNEREDDTLQTVIDYHPKKLEAYNKAILVMKAALIREDILKAAGELFVNVNNSRFSEFDKIIKNTFVKKRYGIVDNFSNDLPYIDSLSNQTMRNAIAGGVLTAAALGTAYTVNRTEAYKIIPSNIKRKIRRKVKRKVMGNLRSSKKSIQKP